jgi:hypothetical protein
MTGINYYLGYTPKEIVKEKNEGHYAFLSGFQMSGLINYVRGESKGAQISPGINYTREMMTGAQIAGVFNFNSRLLTGAQLAVIANISKGSTLGTQIAGLYNKTTSELSGLQIGAINVTETIEGKHSDIENESTAIQIGIFNRARKMHGYQFGIINFGGDCRGTQVGLINFYSPKYKSGKLYGTAIAPLNFGTQASLRIYYDETFPFNVALGTGTMKNGAIQQKLWNYSIMNHLIYRQSALRGSEYRAYGWHVDQQISNSSQDINNDLYFFGINTGISYVDYKGSGFEWNILGEIGISAGSRIIPKNRIACLFVFIDANYFYSGEGRSLRPGYAESFNESSVNQTSHEIWPGYGIGISFQ